MSLGLFNPSYGVTIPILAEKLGVAKSTAAYWARLGLIEPIEGTKPRLFLVPSPEKKERIREAMRERLKAGGTKGGLSTSQLGLSASHAAKAREALAKSPEAHQRATETRTASSGAQVPTGLVDGPTLCRQAGIGLSTLLRWRKGGHLTHSYQCPRLNTLYFTPLSPERVEELREKNKEKQGAPGVPRKPTKTHTENQRSHTEIQKPHTEVRLKSVEESRLSARPAGYLMAEEAAQLAGVNVTTIKSAATRGLIETTKVERWLWFSQESVQTWRSRRGLASQPRMCQVAAERPKTKALVINRSSSYGSEAPRAVTRAEAPALASDGDYEAVVSEAKTVPAFCGVLGFNVWRHNATGEYKAASVSEKPQWPWRYHQKHYKSGWGAWTMASMHPSTGRVDL